MKKLLLIVLPLIAVALPVHAKPQVPHVWPKLGVETQIVFPNQGAIRNFEPDGDDGVWLEDRQRRWYYASLMGYCPDLNFAQAIGFDTRGSATFDRFSSIVVRGDKCQVDSLVTAEKPLPRRERAKLRKAGTAEGRISETSQN